MKKFAPTLEPTIIKLEPNWFLQGYYVYIVKITYKEVNYFYIGMTGDRKYTTARSPFFRMSGHFNLTNSSTENQVIKGLRKVVNSEDNFQNELTNMDICYYSYKINDFNSQDHHNKRIQAEKIESWLIDQFKNEKLDIFNIKISHKYDIETSVVGMPIFLDFKSRIMEK